MLGPAGSYQSCTRQLVRIPAGVGIVRRPPRVRHTTSRDESRPPSPLPRSAVTRVDRLAREASEGAEEAPRPSLTTRGRTQVRWGVAACGADLPITGHTCLERRAELRRRVFDCLSKYHPGRTSESGLERLGFFGDTRAAPRAGPWAALLAGPTTAPSCRGTFGPATAGADTYGWTSRPRASLQPES